MSNLTELLVENIHATPSFKDMDSETKENAKKGVLDYLICCHATVAYDPHFKKVLKSALFSVTDEVPIIGTKDKCHPFDACLINGYSAHALDLDDVHSEIRGHPSAVILSLLLSLIREKQDTNRFYEAYINGIEGMARMAKLLGSAHYEKGFHLTATAGLYGAVIAGAYYLQFSKEDCRDAIDLCVSQISGSRSHFGTLIKPLHAGLTAQKAWQILHFVSREVTGNENTISGTNGLLSMYGNEPINPQLLLEDWGKTWAIDAPGLWFKRYPCCSATAHPIDATKQLLEDHSISIGEIESIRIYFPKNGDAALVYTQPETGEQGRFSAEYCIALLLSGEKLSIENFTKEKIGHPIKELMKKMTRCYDPRIKSQEVSYPKGRYCIVEITLYNGVTYKARNDVPQGSPGNPLNIQDLNAKAKLLLPSTPFRNKLITSFERENIPTIEEIGMLIG